MFNIRVKFDENGRADNRTYVYGCRYTNVKEGDRVIVDSPYNGYTAVTVLEVGVELPNAPRKEVVCTIDDREYKHNLACKERLAEIEKRLAEKKAETEREMKERMLEQLLADDPEVQALKAEQEFLAAANRVSAGAVKTFATMEDLFDFLSNA